MNPDSDRGQVLEYDFTLWMWQCWRTSFWNLSVIFSVHLCMMTISQKWLILSPMDIPKNCFRGKPISRNGPMTHSKREILRAVLWKHMWHVTWVIEVLLRYYPIVLIERRYYLGNKVGSLTVIHCLAVTSMLETKCVGDKIGMLVTSHVTSRVWHLYHLYDIIYNLYDTAYMYKLYWKTCKNPYGYHIRSFKRHFWKCQHSTLSRCSHKKSM